MGNQNQVFQINSNNVAINNLTINGGWIAFGGANSYSNFVFTNNTIENIWCGYRSGGPVALTGPGIISSNISNNSFLNIWGGGSPGYPNTPPQDGTNCPGEDCWGSSALTFSGLDQTTISNNTFDRIAGDGMHITWESFTGYTYARSTSGNVISYNTFTHIRRIPMELQSQPSGNCPGGCNYNPSTGVTTGLQIKGNYVHDYAFPFWNTWGASLVPAGAVGSYFINNTFVANPGNAGGYAPCMESSSINNIVQGNVCESITGAAWSYSAGVAQEWGGNSTQTSTYQNNIFCGTPVAGRVAHETGSQTTIVDQYNYKNGSSCPAGTSLTTSSIAATFIGNASISGSNETWQVSVVSNLSVRYVQFFVDSSTQPAFTQEFSDVNTNFAADRKWLYHLTLSPTSLGTGSHTITAVVTDASGATQSIAQSTNAGSTTAPSNAPLTSPSTTPANSSTPTSIPVCGTLLAAAMPSSPCTPRPAAKAQLAGATTAAPPASATPSHNLPQGMILWLASDAGVVANGDAVDRWEDQSGNANNAVQATPANKPLLVSGNNGLPALHFNGTSSFMSISSLPVDGLTGMTIFAVSSCSWDVDAGYGYYALLSWPDETARWGETFVATYRSFGEFRFGTTQIDNENKVTIPLNRTNSFGLNEWMHTATVDSMWINGQNVASFPGKLPTVEGVGNTVMLGVGHSNTFYPGDVSEIIIYDRSLSDTERQLIEQYLMGKYHL
jgi:hypothetical protein